MKPWRQLVEEDPDWPDWSLELIGHRLGQPPGALIQSVSGADAERLRQAERPAPRPVPDAVAVSDEKPSEFAEVTTRRVRHVPSGAVLERRWDASEFRYEPTWHEGDDESISLLDEAKRVIEGLPPVGPGRPRRSGITVQKVYATAEKLWDKHGRLPTQEQVAAELYCDPRWVRLVCRGQWQAILRAIKDK